MHGRSDFVVIFITLICPFFQNLYNQTFNGKVKITFPFVHTPPSVTESRHNSQNVILHLRK